MRLTTVAICLLMATIASAQEAPRVFVGDTQSWEMRGGSGGSSGAFGGTASGGARPQTAEVIKTLGQKCPQVQVNNIREKSDYVVLFDHEGGKGWARKDNKIAVFNKEGDSIVSKSTMSLGGAVEDACKAILADWSKNKEKYRQGTAASAPAPAPELAAAKISLSSNPAGADIEINGNFVGSTPSVIALASGDHVITVKKDGYKSWQKKIHVSGGDINVAAELQKQN